MQNSSVQNWVDKIQQPRCEQNEFQQKNENESEEPHMSIYNPKAKAAKRFLCRDWSCHSDDSHCSSVESFLEMRKPDPEEMLLELGFGPPKNSSNQCRIPARFLQPSKLLPHIDFNEFLQRYGAKPPDTRSCPASPARMRPKSH